MRIYRVAHATLTATSDDATFPAGPYMTPYIALENACGDIDAACDIATMTTFHGQDPAAHPSPQQDPLLKTMGNGDACGFDTLAALHTWFNGWTDALARCGFTIWVYETQEARVGSHGQVVFRPATADLTGTLPLDHPAPSA